MSFDLDMDFVPLAASRPPRARAILGASSVALRFAEAPMIMYLHLYRVIATCAPNLQPLDTTRAIDCSLHAKRQSYCAPSSLFLVSLLSSSIIDLLATLTWLSLSVQYPVMRFLF